MDPHASDPNASEARGAPTLESDAPPVEDDTSDLTRSRSGSGDAFRSPSRPATLAPVVPPPNVASSSGRRPTHTRPRRADAAPSRATAALAELVVDGRRRRDVTAAASFSASFVLGGGGGGGGGSSDAASAARAARDAAALRVFEPATPLGRASPSSSSSAGAAAAARLLHERYVAAYAWGAPRETAPLGVGRDSDSAAISATPRRVPACDGRDASHFFGGATLRGFVTGDGEVLACDDTEGAGIAGGRPVERSARPVKLAPLGSTLVDVPLSSDADATDSRARGAAPRVVDASCGAAHVAAVTSAGALYTWGSDEFGQLGRGANANPNGPDAPATRDACSSPTLPRPEAEDPSDESPSDDRWYRSPRTRTKPKPKPKPNPTKPPFFPPARVARLSPSLGDGSVFSPPRFSRVSCGDAHVVATTSCGRAYAFGRNAFGELGLGDFTDRHAPERIEALALVHVAHASCGEAHVVAMSAGGAAYAWGRNDRGQLGLGEGFRTVAKLPRPTPIDALKRHRVRVSSVACGGNHSLAIAAASGDVLAWGRGACGPAGTGATADVATPTRIDPAAFGNERAAQISAGDEHSVAVTESGAVFSWGASAGGRLGHRREGDAEARAVSEDDGGEASAPPRRLAVSPVKRVFGLPRGREVLFAVAAGESTVAVVGPRSAAAARGGRPPPLVRGLTRHGAATRPATFPPLLDLAERAKEATRRENENGRDHATAPIVSRLLRAIEDVFSSPGMLSDGFETPGDADEGNERLGLDVASVDRTYDALLAVGRSDVVAALFNASSRGLEELEAFARDADEEEKADALEEEKADALEAEDGPGPAFEAAAWEEFGGEPTSDEEPPRSSTRGASSRLRRLDEGEVTTTCRALIVLWQSPLTGDPAFGDALVPRLLSVVAKLPPRVVRDALVPRLALGVAAISRATFERRLVAPARRFIARRIDARSRLDARGTRSEGDEPGGGGTRDADELEPPSPAAEPLVALAAQALAILHAANELANGAGARASAFRSRALSDALDLRAEYMRWIGWAKEREENGSAGDANEPTLAEAARRSAAMREAIESRSPNRNAAVEPRRRGVPGFPSHLRAGELTSFCQTPFLLTPESKVRILQGEASLQKRHEMRASHLARATLAEAAPDLGEFGAPDAPFLELVVDRARLTNAALDAFASWDEAEPSAAPADLKKPLRVKFSSNDGVAEEGIDEGGVTKEFFQLLVREMFADASRAPESAEGLSPEDEKKSGGGSPEDAPRTPLFAYDAESRHFWFDASAPTDRETLMRYRLIGATLGLAVYNGVNLDVHLPPLTYRRLAERVRSGGEPSSRPEASDKGGEEAVGPLLSDLRELSPSLADGLEALLAYEPNPAEGRGSVEDVFCRAFVAPAGADGTECVELVPGGDGVAVTESNREAFVRLYASHALRTSVEPHFAAFADGFVRVCGGPALGLFSGAELELLVRGEPKLDVKAFRRRARYDGGFDERHATIEAFWRVVEAWPIEKQRRLLFFATGCDRAPVGGLGNLPFVVQRSGPDTDALPTAHTCFNVLLLPEYANEEKLRERLETALAHAEGFGLQ